MKQKFLILSDRDGTDEEYHIIKVNTDLNRDELLEAMKAASTEFVKTKAGKKLYEYNCESFNYGDLIESVPDRICKKHGFEIMKEINEEIYKDGFNTHLVDDNELE